jgi:hypothetical protein
LHLPAVVLITLAQVSHDAKLPFEWAHTLLFVAALVRCGAVALGLLNVAEAVFADAHAMEHADLPRLHAKAAAQALAEAEAEAGGFAAAGVAGGFAVGLPLSAQAGGGGGGSGDAETDAEAAAAAAFAHRGGCDGKLRSRRRQRSRDLSSGDIGGGVSSVLGGGLGLGLSSGLGFGFGGGGRLSSRQFAVFARRAAHFQATRAAFLRAQALPDGFNFPMYLHRTLYGFVLDLVEASPANWAVVSLGGKHLPTALSNTNRAQLL